MRKVTIEKMYGENKGLIYSRARFFAQRTGHDLDELLSEADVVFMNVCRTYKQRNAKFSTYLYKCLTTRLQTFVNKTDLPKEQPEDNLTLSSAHNPRQKLMFKEKIMSLSREARDVAMMLLEGPAEVLGIIGTEPPKMVRGAIQRHLIESGVSHERSWHVLRELQNSF